MGKSELPPNDAVATTVPLLHATLLFSLRVTQRLHIKRLQYKFNGKRTVSMKEIQKPKTIV
jgi:hypothetical protein